MKRSTAALVAVLVTIPIAVLGYGYWFGQTHGALLVSVEDVSDREHPQNVTDIKLSFVDSSGRTVAEAAGIPPYGAIEIVSPSAYSCHDVERRAPFSVEARRQWDECFQRQSRWLPTWIRSVRSVNLRSESCSIRQLPVTVDAYPDTWWLWWVPLPHIGGKPYTSFSVRIEINTRSGCENAAIETVERYGV
jgi:hypothetical protein